MVNKREQFKGENIDRQEIVKMSDAIENVHLIFRERGKINTENMGELAKHFTKDAVEILVEVANGLKTAKDIEIGHNKILKDQEKK